MNTITLSGRITKDIELKATASGKKYTHFVVAVDRRFRDADGQKLTDFFDCIAWNKTAEFLDSYARKGDRVGIVGTLQTRKWEDKDGNKRTQFEIIVEQVERYEFTQKEETNEEPQEQPTQEQPQGELPFEI